MPLRPALAFALALFVAGPASAADKAPATDKPPVAGKAPDATKAPADELAGRILVSDKKFPMTGASAAAYAAAIRKQAKDVFAFDPIRKEATVHFAAFFVRPLVGTTLHLVVTDVGGKGPREVSQTTYNAAEAGGKSQLGELMLRAHDFPTGTKVQIHLNSGESVLASGVFLVESGAAKVNGKPEMTAEGAKPAEGAKKAPPADAKKKAP